MKQEYNHSWRTAIQTTLDTNYITIKINTEKARELESGLKNGCNYLLTLEAGFEIEIIKVVASTNGILTIERGQQGTFPNVWPAGTPIEARITAKALDDLRLNLDDIISSNDEVLLAPNGDIITKPAAKISKTS